MTEPAWRDHSQTSLINPLVALAAALQFLTIIPALVRRPFTAREMAGAVSFFPLVGMLLGASLVGLHWLLRPFPALLGAALLLAAWIILTGALHLDGFLDACDGLFGGHTPDSRLEIMRDEHLGAFAFAGGAILLLLKFAALGTLIDPNPALLLAPVLSRWSLSLAIVAFPYAHQEGVGSDIKMFTSWRNLLVATLFTLGIVWLVGSWFGLAAWILVGLGVWGGALFTLRRIPGLTGDIYGALNEIGEALVLIAFVARVS